MCPRPTSFLNQGAKCGASLRPASNIGLSLFVLWLLLGIRAGWHCSTCDSVFLPQVRSAPGVLISEVRVAKDLVPTLTTSPVKTNAIGEGIRIGINLSFGVAGDRLLCFKLVICLSGHWVARRLATQRTCYCTPWTCQGSMRLRSTRRGRFSPGSHRRDRETQVWTEGVGGPSCEETLLHDLFPSARTTTPNSPRMRLDGVNRRSTHGDIPTQNPTARRRPSESVDRRGTRTFDRPTFGR